MYLRSRIVLLPTVAAWTPMHCLWSEEQVFYYPPSSLLWFTANSVLRTLFRTAMGATGDELGSPEGRRVMRRKYERPHGIRVAGLDVGTPANGIMLIKETV
jgi:hypothetical protein